MRKFLSGRVSAAVLLLLYFVGNVQFESFHEVVHSLEQSLHTAAHEEDPCHRTIYHEVKDDGCDHKTHLTEVKQCPLCHVVPINIQHFEASHSFQPVKISSEFGDYSTYWVVTPPWVDIPARGPPSI